MTECGAETQEYWLYFTGTDERVGASGLREKMVSERGAISQEYWLYSKKAEQSYDAIFSQNTDVAPISGSRIFATKFGRWFSRKRRRRSCAVLPYIPFVRRKLTANTVTTLTCDRSGTQILVENFTDGDIYVMIGTEGSWSLDAAVRIPAGMFRAIEAYETENRVQCSAYNAIRVRADVEGEVQATWM